VTSANTLATRPVTPRSLPVTFGEFASGAQGRNCSVTGGYVYRGQRVPSMYGFYVFGDYCSGKIRTLINFRGKWTMSTLVDTSLLISSFGEDEAGELYVVNLGGAVYRFDPA
jgi:hypothetical protein